MLEASHFPELRTSDKKPSNLSNHLHALKARFRLLMDIPPGHRQRRKEKQEDSFSPRFFVVDRKQQVKRKFLRQFYCWSVIYLIRLPPPFAFNLRFVTNFPLLQRPLWTSEAKFLVSTCIGRQKSYSKTGYHAACDDIVLQYRWSTLSTLKPVFL